MALIDDATLLAELDGDPAGIGYKAGDAFKATAEIARLLTEPHGTIANPSPQPTLPKPFGLDDVLGVLDEPAQARVFSSVHLERILDAIAAQDRVAVGHFATILASTSVGAITADQRAAVLALLAAAGPDPAWPATVPDLSRVEKLGFDGVVHGAQVDRVLGR